MFRECPILLKVNVGLEDSGEERKEGKRGPGGYEAVVDILHWEDERLVGTGLEEEFAGFIPVGVSEVDGGRPAGIDIKGPSCGEDDVVVVAALADQQNLRRLQGFIAVRI